MARTLLIPAVAAVMLAVPTYASRIELPRASEGGFADVVERTLPSVVRIFSSAPGDRRGSGEGSGLVLSADGYLLTNNHVVQGATEIVVQLSDERELPAKLVAADAPTDLAVLKIEAAGLQPIPFGDSARVRIGDYALAIGNPFGVGVTVTLGIVSAKSEGDSIQTDAAINPGNSGGPLLNTNGELIGVNTSIVSPSGASSGVGFAISSNLARAVMSELISKGRVDRGYLGAGFQPLTEGLREALGVERGGAIVSDVTAGSPAQQAGLEKGDVVVAVNGRTLRDFRRLQLVAAQSRPRNVLELTVARQNTEKTLRVELTERPENAPVASAEEVLVGAVLADGGEGAPVVAGVDPQGLSAQVGLMPGDVIVAADRKAVPHIAALRAALSRSSRKAMLLEVRRAGSTYFLAYPAR